MNNLSAIKKVESDIVDSISEIKIEVAETLPKVENKSNFFRANTRQIKDVQSLLKEKLFYKGEISGKFNRETRNSLRKFQKGENIKITGTINAETIAKINRLIVNEIQTSLFNEIECTATDVLPVNLPMEENVFRSQFVSRNYRLAVSKKNPIAFFFSGKSDYLAIAAILLLFSIVLVAAFMFN